MTQTEKREEIDNWKTVPDFETEEEEQAFWDKHCLGGEILRKMEPVEHYPPKSLEKEGKQL
ncbi:MAG: hypothetical protein ACLFQP_09360 [Halothece sp.]